MGVLSTRLMRTQRHGFGHGEKILQTFEWNSQLVSITRNITLDFAACDCTLG